MKWKTSCWRAGCFGLFAVTILLTSGAFAQDAPKTVTKSEGLSAATTKVAPAYPPMAKQVRVEGPVELEALVSEDGTVEKVTIVSGNAMLTHAGADALKKWKFKPFTTDGKPVKAVVPVGMSFKL
jgi:TonB family protein